MYQLHIIVPSSCFVLWSDCPFEIRGSSLPLRLGLFEEVLPPFCLIQEYICLWGQGRDVIQINKESVRQHRPRGHSNPQSGICIRKFLTLLPWQSTYQGQIRILIPTSDSDDVPFTSYLLIEYPSPLKNPVQEALVQDVHF